MTKLYKWNSMGKKPGGMLWLAFICFFLLSGVHLSFAQTTIRGVVTDSENNEPLIGANIIVKGTTTGTVTNVDGSYSLVLPENAQTLVITYIGYIDKEIAVNNRSVIDISMSADIEALEEVVVVGYGTQRKVDLTGSVGSITNEEINVSAPLTADQALRGRISGVQITNRSGDPGSPISVRIRGVGTTGNNQPLFVVDGVPIVQTTNITVNTASNTEGNPLIGINPNDIESIDVLKDASAAAIYGARAANGVVIVTTKRGKEGRTSVTYDGYYGVQSVRKTLDVLNVDQYIDLQEDLGRDFSSFRGQEFVDWQDEVFNSASIQSHNISASGGSELMNFNLSAGYFQQDGIALAQSFERFSVKANSDIKVGKRLKFGESLNISFADRLVQSEPGRAAAFAGAQNAPFLPVRDENGEFTVINAGNAGDAVGTSTQVIGLNDLNNNETRVLSRRILGSIYGELEILEGLKYKVTGGIDFTIGEGSFFQNNYAFGGNGGNNPVELQVVSRPVELTTNIVNTLTYSKNFGVHSLNVLVGYEETNFEFSRLRGQGRGFINTDVTLVNFATDAQSVGQEADQWALRGLLGRVNYTYRDKYLFTANVRRDETSRFAPGNRSDIFPSFSAGWRISEEAFLSGNEIIDNLKLRFAWGQAGNQFTSSSFGYLSTLGLTSLYVIGANQDVVLAPTPFLLANPNLKWEVSTQVDVGVDVSLWKGKLDVGIDYYNKSTNDILVGIPISAVSGFLLPPDVNSGEVVNKGFELSALYRNKAGKFDYAISGNITTVDNEVIALADGSPEIISGFFGLQSHRTIVGESLGHFYGYVTDGIYQTDAEADAALPDDLGTASAGDIRFVDVNNDGRITPEDRTIIGSPIPDFFYGANFTGSYGNFDLTLFLQGSSGQQVFNNTRRTLEAQTSSANQIAEVANRWTGPGTSNTIPRATVTDPNQNNRLSDRWIENAGFLRIQSLQLGYNVPSSLLESLTDNFVTSARFYVSVQNLATFTDYSGYDPEVTRGFSFQKGEQTLASGQDDGFSPQPRIFQLGARLTF